MLKVIYFIIFRSAVSAPLLTAAPLLTLGTAFITVGLHFVFNKLSDYKCLREVELAFNDFKVITSNLIWDNRELQRLVIEACYREHKSMEIIDTEGKGITIQKTKTPQTFSASAVIQARLKDMLDGNDKFRDGTIIKQFNSEDDKLKSIVTKEVEEDGFEDWIEVSIDSSSEKKKDTVSIPPIF